MKLRKVAKFLRKVKSYGLYSKKIINIVEKVLVYFLTYKTETSSDISFDLFSHNIKLNLSYDTFSIRISFLPDVDLMNMFIYVKDTCVYIESDLTLDELFNRLNTPDNFPK